MDCPGFVPEPVAHFLSVKHYHFDCRDKCEKVNAVDKKIIEHTVMKGSLKKKKMTHTSTQTDREEKPKIDIADLTSDGTSISQ
jgi:hypothetical protein